MFTEGFDTIAAISTAPGEGAIGIVRLSGDQALAIADTVYQMGTKQLANQDSHTIHYGHIVDPQSEQEMDEVMVTVLRAPKTYTREDIVEINCHGGMVATDRILQLVLREGARLAEPGEFTKRAFLNGRIDLTQAEAVQDMIRSKTDRSMDQAMKQLDGKLSTKISTLRDKISDAMVQVEVNIDYPEYEEEEMTLELLDQTADAIQAELQNLLQTAKQGKILRDGIETAIIGRPNVGKSSLLNHLLREDKAIVTDIEGTTRDTIEEYVNLRGVPLKLVDTAGIRDTEDVVEKIGVERSRKAMEEADLVLLILNQSEALTDMDRELLTMTKDSTRIILLNKTDLDPALSFDDLADYAGQEEIIKTSITQDQGVDDLEERISQLFFSGRTGDRDATYVSNTRHIDLLQKASQAIGEAKAAIGMGTPVDLIQIDFNRTFEFLGEITGENAPDELITKLFSQFCLGK
ncbi:tRNA uridine-5-carboxymethylaminomethyl(34) synthesis GTPase MnmE [Aerococcus tenax]|uniref:tRNA uridine-5-carboxymethylaminomethyl(34) synthesis GTPase MnmE n=1 Tax=Aerococcus tenax TaxID=3078812 RepID=UPI0018A7A78C|nr:tRNA uridine-5-carboxymethylaminomethyl(34) synthesis GTPase MnmE [Aerococcus tenax]